MLISLHLEALKINYIAYQKHKIVTDFYFIQNTCSAVMYVRK